VPEAGDGDAVSAPLLVYVAGRFSAPTRAGVEENIRRAVELGIEVAKLGAFPVIPHSNTAHPDFETVQPYQFWIAGTLALLRACDVCIMVPGWEASSGATGEREEAARTMPVFYSVEELRAWLDVRELLSGCVRDELRDHAFGDAEIHWIRHGEMVAEGYRGASGTSVSVLDPHSEWDGLFAVPLLGLGKLGRVERNDSGGTIDEDEDDSHLPDVAF
jgi:hypothetical protein